VSLTDELEQIAGAARLYADDGEELAAIIPAEPAQGVRVFLCAYAAGDDERSWIALRPDGQAVLDRALLRDAVSIAALCELAEDYADGVDAIEEPPRVASPGYLDAIGTAARQLEEGPGSRFTEGMKQGSIAVEGLTAEVEGYYKLELG
jgi:hypothetical protein